MHMPHIIAAVALIAYAVLDASAVTIAAKGGVVRSKSSSAYRPTVVTPDYEQIPVVWFIGQSNAQGSPRGTNALASLDLPRTNCLYSFLYRSSVVPAYEAEQNASNPFWNDLEPLFTNHWAGEMSMATQILASVSRLAILKSPYGGASLDVDWEKGNGDGARMYPMALMDFGHAEAELRLEGYEADWRAFVWVQGESDTSDARSAAYETNLTNIISSLRADTGVGTNALWVGVRNCISQTNVYNATYLGRVRDAHTNAPNLVANASWVDVDAVPMWTDGEDAYVHYSDVGFLDMGRIIATNILDNTTIAEDY